MTHSTDPEAPADPPRNKVAPPPPPPPQYAMGRTFNQSTGFNPGSTRLFLEVGVVLLLVAALGVGVIFAGGRLSAWAVPLVPMSVDRSIGELATKQFSLMANDCDNPEALAYVKTVAAPLLRAAEPLPFEFEFRVADTSDVNAFALPGGFVTINFGLLAAAKSGEEVAGVIGHEIQHALLRHGTKRMLRQMGSSALLFLIFGGSDLHSLGQTAGQFAALSYDRGEESEADLRGVDLLVTAGISPAGLATFFERLAKDAPTPPAFMSTHPDPGDRAALVAKAAEGGSFTKLPVPTNIKCSKE